MQHDRITEGSIGKDITYYDSTIDITTLILILLIFRDGNNILFYHASQMCKINNGQRCVKRDACNQ
jgi:hypothetical protein